MIARLTLRNLSAHKLRLLLTTLAVALSVSFVAGSMIFGATATRSFDSLLAERAASEGVSVRAKSTFGSEMTAPRSVPASMVDTLKLQVPDARAVFGQVEGYAAIVRADGTIVGGANTAHLGGAFVDRPDSTIRIVSGRQPTGPEDVMVEEHTATEGRIAVGDTIHVVAQRAAQNMRVVGIFALENEDVGAVVTYVGFAPDVAQRLLTGPDQYSAIWLLPKPGVSRDALVKQVAAVLPAGYEVKTGLDQAEALKEQLENLFSLLSRLLLAFAAISVLVGAFIIFNTFAMLVAQRTRELALLRAVGASRRQVGRVVLGEALGVGLLGSTLGIAVGIGVSYALRFFFARLGAGQVPLRSPVIEPRTVILSYAVGMVVTMIAAYLPARRAGRIPPIAALREGAAIGRRSMTVRVILGAVLAAGGGLLLWGGATTPGQDGAFLVVVGGVVLLLALTMLSPALSRPVISVLGWPIVAVAGAVGRLSRENAKRDPRRSAATASALMVGLALVSVATVVAASLSASVEERVQRQFGAEFVMDPRGLTGFDQEAVRAVAAVPGVLSVTPVQVGSLMLIDTEVAVVVADPAALTQPAGLKLDSGSLAIGNDEILVERGQARAWGWQVGSTFTGRYPDGSATTFRVAGVFADNDVLGQPFLMSPASYQRHANQTLVQQAFVDVDNGRVAATTEAVRETLRPYPNIQLEGREQAKARARADIEQSLNIIIVLLVLSIFIAALGIINTLGLSVIERTREIGLLRAVGMNRSQVGSMIRYEAVMIALYGATLGVALGTGIGYAVQRSMSNTGIEIFDAPVDRLAIYLVSGAVIGVVAAIWPGIRAARMNILTAIHHE